MEITSRIIEEKTCADSRCLPEGYICYSLYVSTLQRSSQGRFLNTDRIAEIYKPCVLPSYVINLRKRLRPCTTCI